MTDTMLGIIGGITGTIIGTIFGWGLSELSKYLDGQRQAEQHKKALYQLMLMEVETLVESMQALLVTLSDEKAVERAKKFYWYDHEPTFWTQEMWAAHLPLLTSAVSSQEFKAFRDCYQLCQAGGALVRALEGETDPSRIKVGIEKASGYATQAISVGNPLLNQLKQKNEYGNVNEICLAHVTT